MRTTAILLSALSALSLAGAQFTAAQAVLDNPVGATYVATLPQRNTTAVRGSISAVAGPGGKGVTFSVSISGLPTSGGPFLYHLHEQPVPSNGNCTGTLAHLDPTKRGEQPPCDASKPELCQVGDLSGKYGKINGTSLSAQYTDLYASTKPGIGAFFGNRSFVVHYSNTTRITCANFTLVGASSGAASSTGAVLKPTGTQGAAPAKFTGAAERVGAGVAAVVGGVAMAFLL